MSREIEIKLLATNNNGYDGVYQDVMWILKGVLESLETGTYLSMYWSTPESSPAKFIRVNTGKYVDITAKVADKGDNVDRLEYAVVVPKESGDELVSLLTVALGEPTALMLKYADFHVGKTTEISIVQNLEQPKYVFVEVESSSREEVDFWAKRLAQSTETAYERVQGSMYSMFVQKHGVIT